MSKKKKKRKKGRPTEIDPIQEVIQTVGRHFVAQSMNSMLERSSYCILHDASILVELSEICAENRIDLHRRFLSMIESYVGQIERAPIPAPPGPLTEEAAQRRAQALIHLILDQEEEGAVVLPCNGFVEVFGRGSEGIRYCSFAGREVSPPSTEVLHELIRMRDKKWRRNRTGHREDLVLELGVLLRKVGNVVEAPVDGTCRPCSRYHLDNIRSYCKEGADEVKQAAERSWYQGLLHILSMTDSPIWISMKEELCRLLVMTELRGVIRDDIRLPHPVLLQEVPPNMISGVSKGRKARLRLILSYILTLNDVSYLMVHPKFSYDSEPDPLYGGLSAAFKLPPTMDGQMDLEVMPEEDQIRLGAMDKLCVFEEEVEYREIFSTLRLFVLNSILYLNSPGAEIEKRDPQQHLALKKRRESKKGAMAVTYKEWIVGSSITIDSKAQAQYGKAPKSYTVHTHSYYVKGFWMHQAHGPGRSLRTLQWRHPQVRRRDLSKVLGKTYVET